MKLSLFFSGIVLWLLAGCGSRPIENFAASTAANFRCSNIDFDEIRVRIRRHEQALRDNSTFSVSLMPEILRLNQTIQSQCSTNAAVALQRCAPNAGTPGWGPQVQASGRASTNSIVWHEPLTGPLTAFGVSATRVTTFVNVGGARVSAAATVSRMDISLNVDTLVRTVDCFLAATR